jgi:hypothetical protein
VSISRLETLIAEGRRLQARLASEPSSALLVASTRDWQRECAAIVTELSGGSKAHWLSRAYSEAFLIRPTDGRTAADAPLGDIIGRIVGVLGQAITSLKQAPAASTADSSPLKRRFDFVHDPALRPVLEAAYVGGRSALEQGEFRTALLTSCSILEAIVTDRLMHDLPADTAPKEPILDWPFGERIAAAERARLIGGGCTRLPAIAWKYRELVGDGKGDPRLVVTEQEARLTSQVLQVILRDLNPGR